MKGVNMKKFIMFLAVGLLICTVLEKRGNVFLSFPARAKSNQTQSTQSVSPVEKAFSQKSSNVQVSGVGKVIKILSDDLKGRRHQKFILELHSGQPLLIVHNIDIAPRISSLGIGDRIEFYGEYEWNTKGGLVHWTHHDPQGRHAAGWLAHEGKRYQ